jgi:TrmH family RNA methyltransferase
VNGERVGPGGEGETIALVLGNEGAGVREEWVARADRLVSIPIRDEAESLNVAIAAGIMLHLTGVR